ncbi:hypothetical protein BBJ28_00018248 [Nothophytophthora sp. Chile5]|nr:hypothetical protein BBJ28_00018248 [Nothophytophthora sp. Chile5]
MPAAAFPASKYGRYKRATSCFLDWLLRARGRGRHAGQKVELEEFTGVVHEIAVEPTSLTPRLLSELPKALAACQCAITLREHVSAFFTDNSDRTSAAAQHGHQHFLKLLKGWYATLAKVEAAQREETAGGAAEERERFTNYYEVLRVADDYFPDEDTWVVEAGAAANEARVDRERVFNEAFAEDLGLEVVYFFLELEELVEGVFTVYDQVKKQQRTLVEATIVVKVAMDNAKALTSRLQLKYPSLKLAEDLIIMVMDRAPAGFQANMAKAVGNFWENFTKQMTYKFVPGMLLVDFVSVGSTLASFTSAIPAGSRTRLILRDGFFGETYGEERTPQYVLPDPSNMVVFLLQQLPLLYNSITATKAATRSGTYRSSGLSGSFMSLMDEYFTTRQVTVPVVFACICWLKSVAALQGHGGLSRNVSLTFKHSTELMQNMKATIATRAVLTADREIHDLLKGCVAKIEQSSRGHSLARANPMMAGFLMLDYHFQYLHMAGEVLMVTSRFRAFGHLYAALADRGHVRRIPFFDRILELYEQMIFTPSRAAAVHGAYTRTYMLSSHMTAGAVDAMFRGVTPPSGSEGIKVRKALHLRDLSMIFRLVSENDQSALGRASSKVMLSDISDICSKELFETRVLSRDMLKLNDDLTDVFSLMCDAMDRRQFHDEYIAHPTPGESRQYRVNRALEDAVMLPLLPCLDALQPDGSLTLSALPGGNWTGLPGNIHAGHLVAMCKKVAAVITAKFASAPMLCERKYFTFPPRPDFVRQEYGTASFKRRTETGNRQDVFSDLMDTLEESSGPLSPSELRQVKTEIKKDPELLVMVSVCSVSSPDANSFSLANVTPDELCSLLHQAAAGPAHDASLVEWMIQMGALTIQPAIHCRKEPRPRDLTIPRKSLSNTMAVHSAVIAGHMDIVRILLEADNLLDLNTLTFHTKESLAHLAVKHGHREIYELLAALGADLRIKDGNGRRVCDVTTDREWSGKIEASIAELETSQASCDSAKDRSTQFRHQGDLRAERLRKAVSDQRDDERRRAFRQSADTAKVETTKKTKKKKGKKGKAADPPAAAPAATTDADSSEVSDLLKTLLVSTNPDSKTEAKKEGPERVTLLGDSIEGTSAMFARLGDPEGAKIDDVQRACNVIGRLTGLVETLSHPSRINSTDRRIRIALSSEATQVIHMMQKFHRFDHPAAVGVAVAPAKALCETTLPFITFVVGTAQLCVSVNRKPQARELLALLEKRLLKMPFDKREPSVFRELVQTYSTARNAMEFGRTSGPEALRGLEWYLDNAVDNYDLQVTLDGMDGHPFYFVYCTTASARQFYDFHGAVADLPDLDGVACFGKRVKHVMYGGSSEGDVAKVRKLLLEVAARSRVQFAESGAQHCTRTANVGEFVFSAAGIARGAAAG